MHMLTESLFSLLIFSFGYKPNSVYAQGLFNTWKQWLGSVPPCSELSHLHCCSLPPVISLESHLLHPEPMLSLLQTGTQRYHFFFFVSLVLLSASIWNLEREYRWTFVQGSKRDTDMKNRLLDPATEGEGGMIRENSMETYTVLYVK